MAVGAIALAGVQRLANHPTETMRGLFQLAVGSFGVGFVIFGPRGWLISVRGGPAPCDGSTSGYPPCYDTGSLDILGTFLGTAGAAANAVGSALGVGGGGSATAPSPAPSASGDTWFSHPNPSPSGTSRGGPGGGGGATDWTWDEGVDGWVSKGLALAGLPDTPENHAWGVSLATQESHGNPTLPQDCGPGNFDYNCAVGNPAMGLMQIIPGTWAATSTGAAYPFASNWSNPVLSVAVRAETQMDRLGYLNPHPGT